MVRRDDVHHEDDRGDRLHLSQSNEMLQNPRPHFHQPLQIVPAADSPPSPPRARPQPLPATAPSSFPPEKDAGLIKESTAYNEPGMSGGEGLALRKRIGASEVSENVWSAV